MSKAELKQVIEGLQKESSLELVRKALKYVPKYLKSQGLTKKLLKEIVRLWAEAGEKTRVVCLLVLIRIYTKLQDKEMKQLVVKMLYNSFLEKCRITKYETMSMIGFMRHSLVEIYKLDPKIAFKQAQTSCMQLTLTLKNAITHKNEETNKTVLNWQFANCLILLSNLITSQEESSPVKSLTHQVIQLNLGAINLLHSPRYYPFYCHLLDNLIDLSESSNLFIPILPIILRILDKLNLPFKKVRTKKKVEEPKTKSENGKGSKNKSPKDKKLNNKRKHESEDEAEDDDDDDSDEMSEEESDGQDSGSAVDLSDLEGFDTDDEGQKEIEKKKDKKTYNLDILNHVSLDEAHELDYIIAVTDRVHKLLVKYLAIQCHRIAFPELVFLPCVQLKKWVRTNTGEPTINQRFKSLLVKIKSDSEKVDGARKQITFSFTDHTAVDAWEKKMKDTGRLGLPKMMEEEQHAN